MFIATNQLAWLATLLQQGEGDTPPWVPIVIILILALIFIVAILQMQEDDEAASDPSPHGADEPPTATDDLEPHAPSEPEPEPTLEPAPEPVPEPEPMPEPEPEPTPEPATPDNLRQIEGIGPKIEQILNQAGITTFAQLANTSVSTLERIVREDAGIRIAFPASWPEQASLAAAGDWEALETLQDNLKGGR